jgi:rare lipoprotein A
MRWGAVVAVGLAGTLAACSASKPKAVEPKPGATQTGIASWYGPGFHGRRTSSGEIYNQYDLTAAHQTLPHGTRVQVTNLTNGRSVSVRINDRGPFVDDRIIDLSYAAAHQIDMIGPGTAMVRLDVAGPEWSNPVQVVEAILPPPPAPVPPAPRAAVDVSPAPSVSADVAVADVPIAPRRPPARQVERAEPMTAATRYAVQVGAFADFDRARQTQRRLELQGARVKLGLVEEAGVRYYRLRLGPFTQQVEAARTVERINALGYPALIVADRATWQ